MVGRVLQPPLSRLALTTSPWGKPTMESFAFVLAGLGGRRGLRATAVDCLSEGILILGQASAAMWPLTPERVKRCKVATRSKVPVLGRPFRT